MKKGNRLLKILAVALCVIMLVSSAGISALAAASTPVGYIESLPYTFNVSAAEYSDFLENHSDAISAIYDGIANMQTQIDISAYNVPFSDYNLLLYIFKRSFPELCYVEKTSISYNPSTQKLLAVKVQYTADCSRMLQEFMDTADELYLPLVNDSMDDFTKAVVLHDALAINNYYPNLEANGGTDGDNYTFMVEHWGVCQYYSECYAYLLAQVGIKSEIIGCSALNHAWMKIQLDGEYYQVDLTWDDVYPDRGGKVIHKYFLFSDSAFPDHNASYNYIHAATSVKYDSYDNLHDFGTQLCLLNGDFYAINSDGKLVKYDPSNDGITVLKTLGFIWRVGSNGWYPGNYSSLVEHNGKLYYNSQTAAYEFDPATGTETKIADAKTGSSLYGLRIIGDSLWGYYADNPNGDKNTLPPVPEYLADLAVPHEVTISDLTHGKVTADTYEAYEGDPVTLTVTPDDGFVVSGVWVNNEMIEPVGGVYSFNMPDEDVVVSARFDFADGISSLAGYTVSLNADIGVNLYMELDTDRFEYENAQMIFTVPNGENTYEVTVDLDDAVEKVIDGTTYYVFSCGVSAKDMSSQITAQVIGDNIEGNVYTCSVKEYAEYMLANAYESDGVTIKNQEYADATPLVKAMLNYGAYSQIVFGNNLDDPANASLSASDKQLGNITAQTIDRSQYFEDLPNDIEFAGATLSLKSETTLSLYFTSTKTLNFTCANKDFDVIKKSGYQIIRIRDISAKELGDVFTVGVLADTVSGTVSYSPMNYCYNVLNRNSDADLQNVVKALYTYWQVAIAYFDYQPVTDY